MLITRSKGKPLADGYMHIMHAAMVPNEDQTRSKKVRHLAISVGRLEVHLSPSEIMELYSRVVREQT